MPDMSQASCSECNRPISDQFVMRVGDSILHEQCLRYLLSQSLPHHLSDQQASGASPAETFSLRAASPSSASSTAATTSTPSSDPAAPDAI